MPSPGTGSTSSTAAARKKVAVFAGNITRKIRKKDGTKDTAARPCILNISKATVAALNLPLATAAQTERSEGDREIEYDGTFHGKTVIVPSPTNQKTAKGSIKSYSFKVPGYLTKKHLKTFFKGTKVESFRIQGGRLKSVPKA